MSPKRRLRKGNPTPRSATPISPAVKGGSRLLAAFKAPFTPGPAADAAPGHVGLRAGVAYWAGLIAVLHTGAALFAVYPTSIIAWAYLLAVASVGILTVVLVPGQWRRWYRWAGLLALSMVVFPGWFFIVMTVGEGWALYRAWTETTPADFHRRYHRAGAWLRNTLPQRKPRPSSAA
ncbi:hypothetical protein LG293_16365 (plasmid) [Citricoccus nitrophenolicus]